MVDQTEEEEKNEKTTTTTRFVLIESMYIVGYWIDYIYYIFINTCITKKKFVTDSRFIKKKKNNLS